ncbi:MAG: hypothetical protein NPMRTH1_1250020 [Nitrosopumilales archaeon]|nr:MAG: hypothetical protein NPMRTH1_1250020 [Nitrosopumilales archaeon]
MEFSIKTKGFDKIDKMLADMIHDLEPEGFMQWANTIEKTAKEICNDPDCKRIKFKANKDMKISMNFADVEAIECLKKAIKQHLNSMSIGLRAFYEQGLPKQLDEIKKNFSV